MAQLTLEERRKIYLKLNRRHEASRLLQAGEHEKAAGTATKGQTISARRVSAGVIVGILAVAVLFAAFLIANGYELGGFAFAGFAAH